jgi:hypothetical protein
VVPLTTRGILQQSPAYRALDDKKKTPLYEALSALTDIAMVEGRLTEKDMVEAGIPRISSKDDKNSAPDPTDKEKLEIEEDAKAKKKAKMSVDKMQESRQRALWLTHAQTIARRRERARQRQAIVEEAKGKAARKQAAKTKRQSNLCRGCKAQYSAHSAEDRAKWKGCDIKDEGGELIHQDWWWCGSTKCQEKCSKHEKECQKTQREDSAKALFDRGDFLPLSPGSGNEEQPEASPEDDIGDDIFNFSF